MCISHFSSVAQLGLVPLRKYANMVTDVNLEVAGTRREGGLSGTNVRNQCYYEVMREVNRQNPADQKNISAPKYFIAGCEAAFPWGKSEQVRMMTDDHVDAYDTPHALTGDDIDRIMDLILIHVAPSPSEHD